jgi:hypothetical protein
MYDSLVNMNMQESGARADEDDEMELPRLEKRWEYDDEEDAQVGIMVDQDKILDSLGMIHDRARRKRAS